MSGKVYLVGAGPGDPSLITVRGRRLLRNADVVVHDYLANPTLLSEVKKECLLIFVGKRHDKHYMEQDAINQVLYREASEGKQVVRLKGGDPFVFGRGAEEALFLKERGIDFEIVPGVSSAYAVPAYAGIPVTHRQLASDVAFITGHQVEQAQSDIDWSKLARGVGTLVFLMGVTNLERISARLIENGRARETPVAVIRWGTMPEQRTVVGTLDDIAGKTAAEGLHPPAVVVVGEVVRLRDELAWFEKRPLFGRRVVVTRAAEQAKELIGRLESLGAEALAFPTIRTEPLPETPVLDSAISHLDEYEWIVFTSANAVRCFLKRLQFSGLDVRALAAVKLAAVGPATAASLTNAGLSADLVPRDYLAEGLVEEFSHLDLAGAKILLPRAEVAREVLPEQLRELGAEPVVAPCYRTETVKADPTPIAVPLRQGKISCVTFTSGSTVRGYAELLSNEPDAAELLSLTNAVCIGPVTEKTAAKLGLRVAAVAEESTAEGMVRAIMGLFGVDEGRN